MIKRMLLATGTLILLSYFTGCGLTGLENNNQDSTIQSLEGTWISKGNPADNIIVFDGKTATFYNYNRVDSIIDTVSAEFQLSDDNLDIFITKTNGAVKTTDTLPLILSASLLKLSDLSYIKYTGIIPPADWVKKDVKDADSAVVINGVPKGTWKTTDTPMDEIINISDDSVTIYSYEPNDSSLNIMTVAYTINNTKDSIIIAKNNYDITSTKYTVVNDTFIIINIDSTNIIDTSKYVGYTEATIPPESWIIKNSVDTTKDSSTIIDTIIAIDSGSFVNNVPSGSWQIDSTPMDEIVMLGKDSIKIYDYNYSDSSINIMAIPYSIDSINQNFIVSADSGMIDTIHYEYLNSILKIAEPDGNMSDFKVYSSTKLPTDWVIKNITNDTIDDSTHNDGIERVWLSEDSLLIFEIRDDSIAIFKYNSIDSSMDVKVYSYSLNSSSDSIIIMTPNGTESYEILLDSASLILKNSTETLPFTQYDGEMIPTFWNVKDMGIPIMGLWVVVGDNPDIVLDIRDSSIEKITYNFTDSTVNKVNDIYHLNPSIDTLTVTDSLSDKKYGISIISDTLTLTSAAESITYARYFGPVPLSSWIIKNGGTNNGDISGMWIVDNGNRDSVIQIWDDTLVIHHYIAADSMFYTDWYNYTSSDSSDTLYLVGKSGSINVAVNFSGDSLQISSSTLNASLIRSTDYQFPLTDWVLTNMNPPIMEPYFGEWISPDSQNIVTIGPKVIHIFAYDSITDSVNLIAEEHLGGKVGDTIAVTGNSPVKSFIITDNSGILSIEYSNNISYTLNKFNGEIPLASWAVTNSNDIAFTTNKYVGSWLIDNTEKDEIVTIGATLISITHYNSTDSTFFTDMMDYKINSTEDSLVIISDDGDMSIPISLTGAILTVTPDENGPKTYNSYTGEIPYVNWIIK